MSNIQNQKNGTVPIEEVSFVAHRDPMFQTELLYKAAAGPYALPTTPINYGPRGAGRLGIVVGADKAVPTFDVTFTIRDIDGLIIGSAVTQTIAETAINTSVLYALNLTQQQILRGQTITFSGNVVLAALGTKLIVKLVEQSPEQEVTVSGDGIATEASAADIKAGVGAPTDAPVADNTTIENATSRSSVSLLKRISNLLIALLKQAYISATNHLRTNEISPLDTRDVALTTNASNVTVGAATVCFPANASTPTSNWNTHSLNAAGGKARRISFNGKVYLPNTKTAVIKLYVSDDPNATSASKNWVQKYFIDNDGSVVPSKTLTGSGAGTTETFAIQTSYPLASQYVYLAVTGNDAGVNALYIYGSAGW